MACFRPLKAFRLDDGTISFGGAVALHQTLLLPCGKCVGCRMERGRQMAVRCMHEASLWPSNLFVTLTYDDKYLRSWSLVHNDFQLFMKRLRKQQKVRYFMCGEYGERSGRPHFHAILFNCYFPDRKVYGGGSTRERLYISDKLSALWPFGFSSFGDVTFESASYVARYAQDSVVTGADVRRRDLSEYPVDEETGELLGPVAEYVRMSLKPGIGAKWLEKFSSEVYPHDRVVMRGKEMKPPRYYDRIASECELKDLFDLEYRRDLSVGFQLESVEFKRLTDAMEREYDATPERLDVREQVAKARLNLKERNL